ncbi:MAG: NUDIX hydrolase [Acholeplasmataceae bacterium]|nr:NUDIX hydrolase [Acholeplasmataceae bacterium]
MDYKEKTINSEYIYKGKIIKLRKDCISLPNGKEAFREVVEHPGGACCLVKCPDGKILFVRQYRKPYEKMLYELPAGKLEPDESPDTTIVRELSEEAGIIPNALEKIGIMLPSPGYSNEVIHLYYTDDYRAGQNDLDEDEFLDLVAIPVEQVLAMIENGEIVDAKSVILILRCKERIM